MLSYVNQEPGTIEIHFIAFGESQSITSLTLFGCVGGWVGGWVGEGDLLPSFRLAPFPLTVLLRTVDQFLCTGGRVMRVGGEWESWEGR